MAAGILPSGPGAPPPRWSPDHLRLHRSLLRQPGLLPRGAPLLLAVSGGQDSMAMTGLLRDLCGLHQWRLHLWHGDHGWRRESQQQALELRGWADNQGLPIRIERLMPLPSSGNREARARRWRYQCLQREALRLGCLHVLTAHTASDRAETVLLHLARGSHQRGLATLRRRLPLAAVLEEGLPVATRGSSGSDAAQTIPIDREDGEVAPPGQPPAVPDPDAVRRPAAITDHEPDRTTIWLVRPLQLLTRQDTDRLCRREGWPVWQDVSNSQLDLSRNRIRAQVLPVLEQLHPGAARRISEQAERLAAEQEQQQELLELALMSVQTARLELDRRALLELSVPSQGLLLQHWLRRCRGQALDSRSLASLLPRLVMRQGPGRMDLAGGWQLCWRGTTLALRPPHPSIGHG